MVSCVALATQTGQWSTGVWLQGAVTLIRMASACSRISICIRSGIGVGRCSDLGGGDIFKYDFLLLLVDTNEEQCLKYYNTEWSSLCKQWVKLGGDAPPPPLPTPMSGLHKLREQGWVGGYQQFCVACMHIEANCFD